MRTYKSEVHRINVEALSMSEAERRRMVAEAMQVFGPAAAVALAARFDIPFEYPGAKPAGKRSRGARKRT